MTSPAQTAAVNKYIKKQMRRFTLQCNKETDADIIEALDSTGNYNKALKEIIRKAIKDGSFPLSSR